MATQRDVNKKQMIAKEGRNRIMNNLRSTFKNQDYLTVSAGITLIDQIISEAGAEYEYSYAVVVPLPNNPTAGIKVLNLDPIIPKGAQSVSLRASIWGIGRVDFMTGGEVRMSENLEVRKSDNRDVRRFVLPMNSDHPQEIQYRIIGTPELEIQVLGWQE